ncbi:hypothetical protein FGRMN_408 [Fusarium graminum]|nr:hypothetical protein FGRMN_408 [Fusarium graminum]
MRRLRFSSFCTSDDILIFVSMILVIVQSTTVYFQGSNGLGKLDVSASQASSILKGQFVSDILFFIALGLSKLSATTTVGNMSPLTHMKLLPIQILIGGWTLSAVLVRGFACSLPSSWDYIDGQCVDLVAFWTYVDAVNIVTDLLITAVTIQILIHLQMPLGTKAMVVGVFGSRILMIPPAVSHIMFYKQALESNTPIFDMWKPTVIVQVIQCVGITTTCIPFWWRFLKSLESGQMGAGDLFGAMSRSNNSRSGGTKSRSRGDTTVTSSSASRRAQAFELTSKQGWQGSGEVKKYAHIVTDHGKGRTWDAARQNSQEALVDPSTCAPAGG